MILCVFLTFSTVNAVNLNDSILNSTVIDSQSESSFTNLNEDISNDVVKINEDEDCVESVNELSNLNNENFDLMDENGLKSSLSSINSDENSLKSTLSPSGNTFSSIQDSISSAKSGDTINLNGKTYTSNGTVITIDKSLTIIGGQGSVKATLDAKKLSGIFKISSANVKLINCNFINANDKAVHFMKDNGTVTNCDFKDNYAHTNSHLIVAYAVENFLLENSNFYNGHALNYTNVALLAKNSTVKNCSFINNTVMNDNYEPVNGAGLQIGHYTGEISIGSVINCVFINNTAISNSNETHAGGLCFRPGIKVYNTSFINNYCKILI